MIDPVSGILDRNTDGDTTIRLRFNNAIDLFEPNKNFFAVYNSAGQPQDIEVEIINNDAILSLQAPQLLAVGERITVEVLQGLSASKPIIQNGEQINLQIYELESTQTIDLIYRGSRPDLVLIDAVVPRRIQANIESSATISMLGIPNDLSRIRAFIGNTPLALESIEQNSEDERIGILTVTVPQITQSGQYDLTVLVEKDGIIETAFLYGAFQVDAPIRFDELSPQWGPISGGTVVTITGVGFEPGNTVFEGLSIEVGSQPVRNIEVLSSTKIRIVTPRGVNGRNDVFGRDRYGNRTSLTGENGFGYGIQQLANIRPELVNPVDLIVDQSTGVAAVATGYFRDFEFNDVLRLPELNEVNFAATFDVQNPSSPLLVGGSPTLPSGVEGIAELDRYQRQAELLSKLAASQSSFNPGPPLTAEEQRELDDLGPVTLPFSVDSLRLDRGSVLEDGVERQRLFVASGRGGIAQLNFDDQNGLQTINRIMSGGVIRDVEKTGFSVFASSASGADAEPPRDECASATGPINSGSVSAFSYIDPSDPIRLTNSPAISGGDILYFNNGWLYAGGNTQGALWGPCPQAWEEETAAIASDRSDRDSIQSINLFDPFLTQEFSFDGTVFDVVNYGNYLIAALGINGIDIIDRRTPEVRTRVNLNQLQAETSSAIRLKLYGNLLFVSARGAGLIVLDLSSPLSPAVVSAGNNEAIHTLDIFRDRVIAGGNTTGMRVLQLPAAFVASSSVEEGAYVATNEVYSVTFNEVVATESMQREGVVNVIRLDSNESVEFSVTPLNVTDSSASEYRIDFERAPNVTYRVSIDGVRTLRSTGQWAPFTQTFT